MLWFYLKSMMYKVGEGEIELKKKNILLGNDRCL